MDFINRNIILRTTFSIVILYMITPAFTYNQFTWLCLNELIADNFNVNLENSIQNILNSIEPTDEEVGPITANVQIPNTPYSKAYILLLKDYKVNMYSRTFCMWFNMDVELNQQNISMYGYRNLPLIWKNIVQSLTSLVDDSGNIYSYLETYRYLYMLFKSLCIFDLYEDHFDTDINNRDNYGQLDPVPIVTPHGNAYSNLNDDRGYNLTPLGFCRWTYNYNHNHLLIWHHLKYQINNDICKRQIQNDELDFEIGEWEIYKLALTDGLFEELKTWQGQEYGRSILNTEIGDLENYKSSEEFCNEYAQLRLHFI